MLSEGSYRIVLVGLLVAIILASSVLVVWSMTPNQFSASGTFPGENGKIAFNSNRDSNQEIYTMNADGGSEHTRLTNDPPGDGSSDWGPIGTPPEDTSPPIIMIPDDITQEATSPDGATILFEEVSAQDDEDGPVDVSCDHKSGETFPIGETVIACSAEDMAGNTEQDQFIWTVNPPAAVAAPGRQ